MESEARRTADALMQPTSPSENGTSTEPGAAPGAGIYRRVFEEGPQFDFFQAVLLLERFFKDAPPPGTSPLRAEDRILFRPYHVLAFPVADVREIEWLKGDTPKARITATFLGLYGIDSPLPDPFHEDISLERVEGDALRLFLDIFNHRFYAYFYRAWKKYRPALNYRPGKEDEHLRRLTGLAGLGTPGVHLEEGGELVSLLRLTGLGGHLAPQTRNAEGLQTLVDEVLGGTAGGFQVRVIENIPRWVTIPERPQMGKGEGMQLGVNTTIGTRIYDASGKFRLEIGPLDLKTYLALLPGGAKAAMIKALVRLYVPDYLDFDVELRLKAEDVPPMKLGDPQIQLGLMTCLGRPTSDVIARVVTYPEATA